MTRHAPMTRMIAPIALGIAALILVAGAASRALGPDTGLLRSYEVSVMDPHLVILKSQRLLHLFDGDRLVRTYPMDLGHEPVGPKRRAGDGRTPVGTYRVITKNPESAYHRFIGLDYPDLSATKWGLRQGLISPGEAKSIRAALAAGRCPNWATGLGGGIGIHGGRKGRDWTGGCVAVSDEAAEELYRLLRIGDSVEILP